MSLEDQTPQPMDTSIGQKLEMFDSFGLRRLDKEFERMSLFQDQALVISISYHCYISYNIASVVLIALSICLIPPGNASRPLLQHGHKYTDLLDVENEVIT